MSYKKQYFWKDNKGEVKTSMGIELTKEEQQELCRKNLQLIKDTCKGSPNLQENKDCQ